MIFTAGAIYVCLSMFSVVEAFIIMRTAPSYIIAMIAFFLLGLGSLSLGWNIATYMGETNASIPVSHPADNRDRR